MANPTPGESDDLAAAIRQLSTVMAAREIQPPEFSGTELVTVGATSEADLDRKIYCRDCLDVRYSAGPTEPPQGGSAWGSHTTSVSGHKVKVEHPRKPKLLSYDRKAVLEGLKKGTHGKQCIQCGSSMHPLAV